MARHPALPTPRRVSGGTSWAATRLLAAPAADLKAVITDEPAPAVKQTADALRDGSGVPDLSDGGAAAVVGGYSVTPREPATLYSGHHQADWQLLVP